MQATTNPMCLTDTQQCALRRSVTGRVHSVHHHESTRLCFLCMVGQCPVQQHLGVTPTGNSTGAAEDQL